MDTCARSIWVDRKWFLAHRGTIVDDANTATAADGHEMYVCGKGQLEFRMWGVRFREEVRVAVVFSSKLLIGSRFGTNMGYL